MKSLTDQLPWEVARKIHPDWYKNEAGYWSVRDQLIKQYQDQWIGFADGVVIASGSSPVAVFHAAEESGRNPFVTCVGREDEPCRMRRINFTYDVTYPGEAIPILTLEFRSLSGSPGMALDRVIADTGADATALPWADCQMLRLDPTLGRPDGWGVSRVVRLLLCFSACGFTSMAKNIHADFKPISWAMSGSWAATF